MKATEKIFVDPRILNDVVEDLKSYGFDSVKAESSSRQPLIIFTGNEGEIEDWMQNNKWGFISE